MTLRELLDSGVVSLDQIVHWDWWDAQADEPSIMEPDEWAEECLLSLNDKFQLLERIHFYNKYIVTSIPDPETGEGEYKVEQVKEAEHENQSKTNPD